jgi:hypothetical protein
MKNVLLIIVSICLGISGFLPAQDFEAPLASETSGSEFSPSSTNLKPMEINRESFEVIRANKEYGKEYFPLNIGKVYHFDSNVGETTAEFKPDDNGVILTFDAPNMEYKQTLLQKDEGIFLTRTETSAFMFFGNDIKYTEPVLRIPFPVKQGDKWEWHALETEDEDTTKLTIKGEILGEEFVTTPAGKFKSLKIRQYVSSEGGSSNVLTEWFAPQIGLVKSHAVLEGQGITGMIQDLLGFDEVQFELVAFENAADSSEQ